MRPLLALAASTLLLALASPAQAWNVLPPGPEGWQAAGHAGIRGVTIGPIESIQQPHRGYGTARSAALLDHLQAMGVGWVSITPFGRIWSLESERIRMDFEAPYPANREAVMGVIRQAKARGMKVLLVPHLWVETEGWRGEIDPGDAAGWEAYRESYRAFVLAWARDAAEAGADMLSVGVECKSWSGRFGGWWTDFIAEVRAVFPGLLTYSANWDEAEDVLFWDQLDLIGINAFYPLAEADGASDAAYAEGAERIVPQVRALAEGFQMPVLFVEVGYTTRANAAVQPWLWPDGMDGVVIDERERARALDASFHAFLDEPWFVGFFVWRYYATLEDVSQEAIWGFSPHAKMAEPLLVETFDARWAVDPIPWPWSTGEPVPAPDPLPPVPPLSHWRD
ncbi:MAG: hypothetical protein CMH59_06755 [Myxococcales bacterium]|nr:hypothetical protein [Myxococcales bacterium]HJK95134.1 hypothetical protein [Polyangiaceae bacterium LLY-WYZ-15_(1-7)]